MTHDRTSNACRQDRHKKCKGVVYHATKNVTHKCRCRCHVKVVHPGGVMTDG